MMIVRTENRVKLQLRGIIVVAIIFCLIFCSNTFGATSSLGDENDSYEIISTSLIDSLISNSRKSMSVSSEQSYQIASKALEMSLNLNYKSGKLNSLHILSISSYYLGQYSVSLKYMNQLLAIYKSEKDSVKMAEVFNNLGQVYSDIADYEKALDYFLKSLYLKTLQENEKGIAYTKNNIGLVYYHLYDLSKALSYYKEALIYFKSHNNLADLATLYNNIGLVYYDQKNINSAIENFTKAIESYKKNDDKNGIANTLNSLGLAWLENKNYTKAINLFNQSSEISKTLKYTDNWVYANYNLGYAYNKTGDYNLAIKYFNLCIPEAEKIASKKVLSKAYREVAFALKKLEKYETALFYHQKYKLLNDSLYNYENYETINKLEANFNEQINMLQAENNKKQLALNKNRNYIIVLSISILLLLMAGVILYLHQKIKNRDKEIELHQKLFRLQMNPHFIFNALSSIQSYIFESSVKEASNYLSGFANLIRSILENSRVEYNSVQNEIKTLKNYLEIQKLRFSNRFTFKLNIDPAIDLTSKMPPMLAQPFIENAIEHGFKNINQKGFIGVNFSKIDGLLNITIEDNGIGINKGLRNRSKNGNQLAVEITRQRIHNLNKKLKGKLNFEIYDKEDLNGENHGTVVKFDIPVNS